MTKGKHFIIKGTIYPFDILVSMGETDEQVRRHLEKGGIKDPFEIVMKGQGRAIMFSGGQTMIRTKNLPKTVRDYGVLQHEIFHAVVFILERVGMKLTPESDEAYAYMIEYLTVQIFKNLSK